MADFKITFLMEGDETTVVDCSEDEFILDAADEAGVALPYSCRAGACSSCAGLIVEGSVDQKEQTFLDDEQLDKGFVLTCIAVPKSNCTIETHKEDLLY